MELKSNGEFHRIFWSYSAARKWLNLQKQLLSVDRAFLKSTHGGTLLSLASEDSEDRSVVLAIAIIIEAESAEEWTWFLHHCKNHFSEMDRVGVGIVSDRDKGSKKDFFEFFFNS